MDTVVDGSMLRKYKIADLLRKHKVGVYFACRHCYQLAYPCQRDSSDDGTLRKVGKMRSRLGWARSLISGCSGRPKGMHRSTYLRRLEELDPLQMQLLFALANRIGLKI